MNQDFSPQATEIASNAHPILYRRRVPASVCLAPVEQKLPLIIPAIFVLPVTSPLRKNNVTSVHQEPFLGKVNASVRTVDLECNRTLIIQCANPVHREPIRMVAVNAPLARVVMLLPTSDLQYALAAHAALSLMEQTALSVQTELSHWRTNSATFVLPATSLEKASANVPHVDQDRSQPPIVLNAYHAQTTQFLPEMGHVEHAPQAQFPQEILPVSLAGAG